MDTSNQHEDLDLYPEIIDAYDKIIGGIDFLVHCGPVFTEPSDPRKLKIDEFMHNLKYDMEGIIQESKDVFAVMEEVKDRFNKMDVEFHCDACGSRVDTRVGLMKWDNDKDPSTPEEWEIMEKINDQLGVPVRWVTICKNPGCQKIWKEGEFEEEIVQPQSEQIKIKIRTEVRKERGLD